MKYSESDKEKLNAAIDQREKKERISDENLSSDGKIISSDETDSAPASTENYLENYTKNPFKRMKNERKRMSEAMKDMNTVEKIKYFIYYYKWHVFVGFIIVFFILYIINFIYQRSLPVAMSYAIINNNNMNGDTDTGIFKEYAAYYGMEKGHRTEAVTDIILSNSEIAEGSDGEMVNNYKYMSFATYCSEDYFDIVITDKEGMDICSSKSHIYPVDQILSSENLEKCRTMGLLTESKSADGSTAFYGIDISAVPAIQGMHLRYNDAYLCFPGHSERNIENANKFFEFLFK